jgi:heme-degrading monooxygenase HmoA
MELPMFARVMTSIVRPESINAAVVEWPRHISAFKGKGLIAGYLFLDRSKNEFLSITVWDSEESQRRNAASPEQIHGRSEFTKHLTGAPVPSTYEVVATVS